MKKLFTIILAAILTNAAFAQHRYHIDNVTDYTKIQSTSNGQRRVGTRESAPLPCTGSPKIPVVLVQFSDLSFSSDTIYNKTIIHSDAMVNVFFDKFCNGTDKKEDYRYTIGSVGTVKQYFMAQSDTLFQPEFVVIGPVTLSKSWQYYGEDTGNYSKDVHVTEFYREALEDATKTGVDWNQFDNNNDGIVDFVFFIYAGEGQNSYGSISDIEDHNNKYPDDQLSLDKADLIWPKEWTTTMSVNSTKFGGCGCTNEIYNEKTDGIGTMCHELSHGLGLPDLYDTSGKSFGLDFYDIMDSGNYCNMGRSPVEYSSYEREFMGWRKTETIDISKSQTITINPIEKGGIGYKILNPANPNEYYLLENRQNINFDFYYSYVSNYYKKIFGENKGLIVYHVNYSRESWAGNTVNSNALKQNFTILPADGNLISSSIGYEDEYFLSLKGDLYPNDSLNVTSIDSSRFTTWIGSGINVNITRIQQNEDLSVTIDINGGGPVDAIDYIVDENVIKEEDSAIYDLSGRRILKPEHGFYISRGKKYFVR